MKIKLMQMKDDENVLYSFFEIWYDDDGVGGVVTGLKNCKMRRQRYDGCFNKMAHQQI